MIVCKKFKGPDKWIPVIVSHITGPVSYQVKLLLAPFNGVMLINFDIAIPLTVTIKSQMTLMISLFLPLHEPTTDAPSNLE